MHCRYILNYNTRGSTCHCNTPTNRKVMIASQESKHTTLKHTAVFKYKKDLFCVIRKSSKLEWQTSSKPRTDLHKVCIGNIFLVSDLKPGMQCYFDTFAVLTNTNITTVYIGTFVRRRRRLNRKRLN